jgi:2-aminoadipate transaminase
VPSKSSSPWQEQVKRFREVYAERATTMLDALGRQMPRGVRWTRPTGGFYVWLTLPPGLDTSDLLAKAIQHRVAYVPGRGFYADGTGGSQLRLCYSFPPPERIVEGVERLGELVEQELELVHAVYGDTVPQVDQARGGTGVAERGG